MNGILPIRGLRPRCRQTLSLGLSLLVGCGVATAATKENVPEGIPVGPLFLTPWFTSDVFADDNLFRRNESLDPVADVITTLRAGVEATIPIRMSDLQIGYRGSTFFYRDSSFEGTDAHEGSVLFNLNFSSHHRLIFSEIHANGVTEQQSIDESGELVRQGIPYRRNEASVEWLREVAHRPSWRTRIEHVDHRYESDGLLPWLDFRGWAIDYEYAQPIYRRGALTGRYYAQRQDHFEAGRESNLTPAVPDDVPLRREEYDAVEFGYRGIVGKNQPLYVSLGYGRFAFRDVQRSDADKDDPLPVDYEGVVGNVLWRLPLGGSSKLDISAARVPLSSTFNTYYLVNNIRVGMERRFREVSRYGVSLLVSNNRYGDVVTRTANDLGTLACGDAVREDRRRQIVGFWEWFIQPRIALRVTADHNRRSSNCELSSYRANGVGLTFKVGWF